MAPPQCPCPAEYTNEGLRNSAIMSANMCFHNATSKASRIYKCSANSFRSQSILALSARLVRITRMGGRAVPTYSRAVRLAFSSCADTCENERWDFNCLAMKLSRRQRCLESEAGTKLEQLTPALSGPVSWHAVVFGEKSRPRSQLHPSNLLISI